MAQWSAALFGHYKPRYYLRERKSGLLMMDFVDLPSETFWDEEKYYVYPVQGWERRAEPGDIVAVRPIAEANRWTDTERKLFLIVELDDFEPEQLAGVTEPHWDTTAYPVIPNEVLTKMEQTGEVVDLFPSQYHKKRRFNVPLSDLSAMGVDTAKMLDKNVLYTPKMDTIKRIGCFDKMKQRKAAATDNFRLIEPVKIGAGYGKGGLR